MDQVFYEALLPFGALRNYRGYGQLMIALKIILEDPFRLEYITSVYIDIAMQCNCSYSSVERNLRTLIKIMWIRNAAYMMELAGGTLDKCPTVSQFLDILSLYIQRAASGKQPVCIQ